MTRDVIVRIDRLIVEGMPAAEARRVAGDIRAELERELRLPGGVDRLLSRWAVPGSAHPLLSRHGRAPTQDDSAQGVAAGSLARGSAGERPNIGAAVARQILGSPR